MKSSTQQSTVWIARLGLSILALLLVALVSGIALFVYRRGWLGYPFQATILPVHVYVSILSIPFLASKIWGTLHLLVGAPSSGPVPMSDRAASVATIVFSVVLYVSGLLLTSNTAIGGNARVIDAHLFSMLALLASLSWHLYHRLRQAWAAAVTDSGASHPAHWGTVLYSRRALLALSLAVATSAASRWAGGARPSDDPNDFPVTNFGSPSNIRDLENWRLEVRGQVGNLLSLSYTDLLGLPRERHRFLLQCVTGWTAIRVWEGIPVSKLLEIARPLNSEARLRFLSATGYEIIMPPSKYRRDGAMVVTHVDSVPLTGDHGSPARLLVPDVVGEENVKWLTAIEVLSP